VTKPPPDPWTVAIHATAADHHPIGAGVVIDDKLVLTCEHVVFKDGGLLDEIWIAFPKASTVSWSNRRRVSRCLHNGRPEHNLDVVLLELAEPVPGGVTPARLRCVSPDDLAAGAWWTFGFPNGAESGSSARGTVGDPLAQGLIHLERDSKSVLAPGFSGSPLWSAEYEAVVGLVVAAEKTGPTAGNGHALMLSHVGKHMPDMKLSTLAGWRAEDADDTALSAWGWMLSTDQEAGRHWLPRARGVASDTERGHRFRGRAAALRRLVEWLDLAAPDGRPMVVTGSPGVGKSAVLGRIVTTADRRISESLAPDDDAVRATVGSVACAVHAKGKTASEVAAEIARAASVSIPVTPADLAPILRERLARRPERFNVVIDALDEAATTSEARQLVHDVVLPVARGCARFGVQVVVGTRRADDAGDLLTQFGSAIELVDLDDARYFTEADLADYALATLRGVGAGEPLSPYSEDEIAGPVARRIAMLAEGNFLVAGLVARARALRDTAPVDPDQVSFAATVGAALDSYVAGLPDAGTTSPRLALTALAFAETPGLPLPLWRAAVATLGGSATEDELAVFAQRSAANFLVETGSPTAPVYRLFHQALNEALLGARAKVSPRRVDERELLFAWVRCGHRAGWAEAPEYLLRSLPQHAARAREIDTLLNDHEYLLHANLERLLPAAEDAATGVGRARAQLLQRTPSAVTADAAERAALFSVVDRLDGLGSMLEPSPDAPYFARWARTPARLERTVLEGHSDAVCDVCAVPADGRSFLASAGEDGTVRLWDPLTSQTERVLDCHDDCIRGVYAVGDGNRTLLATAGHDSTIGLWDPRTGAHVRTLHGHGDWVRNLCAVPMASGRSLLASASDDRTVRLWDPATGALLHVLRGHAGWVTAVTHVAAGPHGMVASTGFDGTIRLWDPESGQALATLTGHDGWVTTLCEVGTPRGALLASAGYDGTVRLWDPVSGTQQWRIDVGAGPLTDVCALQSDGRVLLCSTGEDGVIRIWDTATGEPLPELRGHVNWIRAICALPVGGRQRLATAGDDGTVRLWDPLTGLLPEQVMDTGHLGPIAAVCAAPSAAGDAVASAGSDGAVRLWDPRTGAARAELRAHVAASTDVCSVVDEGRYLLVAASENPAVAMWDLDADDFMYTLEGHHERVNAVCALDVDGRPLLASAADDETIRVWEPGSGVVRDVLLGHRNWVTALAAVTVRGRQMLASADKNGIVRLWDHDGGCAWENHGHHDAVNALCAVTSNDREVLVSAGADCVIRLWDPDGGRPLPGFTGHSGPVTGVCPVPYGGRQLLASTSLDRTVRLWDPATGRALRSIPVHHRALACRYVDGTLILGLDRGLLALALPGRSAPEGDLVQTRI
jgi:WD40 repeat protein